MIPRIISGSPQRPRSHGQKAMNSHPISSAGHWFFAHFNAFHPVPQSPPITRLLGVRPRPHIKRGGTATGTARHGLPDRGVTAAGSSSNRCNLVFFGQSVPNSPSIAWELPGSRALDHVGGTRQGNRLRLASGSYGSRARSAFNHVRKNRLVFWRISTLFIQCPNRLQSRAGSAFDHVRTSSEAGRRLGLRDTVSDRGVTAAGSSSNWCNLVKFG
jgi:hypothetical protein